jgi:GT2 family glycosyltransferase
MVSIVIPNYNKFDLLMNCVKSLEQQNVDIEIIIVDNCSTNIEQLHIDNKAVRFIYLSKNEGFSKAVNIGIKQAKGDYIAILNNDTEVDPNWIRNVLKAFKNNPDIKFITSKIKSLRDKQVIDDVGDVILYSGKVYKIGNNEKDEGQYDKKRFVFGASGCASIYRRDFFDRVGYFDEDFFAYIEDVDISFRASLLGLKCLYVPDAVVYHVGSATTGSQYNDFTIFYLAQNTVNVIIKNFPAKLLIKFIPLILTHVLSLQAFFILNSGGLQFFRGIISAFKMLPKMTVKRNEIMKNRILTDKELTKMLKDNKSQYRVSKKKQSQ